MKSLFNPRANKRAKTLLGAAGAAAGGYMALRLLTRPLPLHTFLKQDGLIAMAHRGGGGLWPQNTLYAFSRAAGLGVDVLELDIQQTRDGVLVVMHDPIVDNTTNGRGEIHSMSLLEIKALDAGYCWTADGGQTFPFRGKGIRVPTLHELLEAFPHTRLNIDIKPQDPAVVEPFVRLLSDYGRLQSVMVGSFHDDQLRRFRQLAPQTATAAGVTETRLFYALNRAGLSRAYRPKAQAFQIPEQAEGRQIVTPRFVRSAHAHRIQVHVWTVDEVSHMNRLIDWGVDGLISDYPDRLMKTLGRDRLAVYSTRGEP
jgi:glycerophosphoryl diester phosphodiesterase